MTTAVQVQYRRGTATQVASFTGAQGELIVDTTDNRIVVQDGSTAGGWPAAKLSEVIVNTRTAVSDASYTALATDRSIAYTAITAARIVTLPASNAYPTGTQLLVVDESGSCSATNTITVSRAGSDTIDSATSAVISSAYGYLALQTNGAGKWTIVDQSTTSLPAVAIGTLFDPNNVLSVVGASALFSSASNFNITVNKGGSGGVSSNTASFIFEDGFSGRAQIGLCGDDNFHFKVSPNGSTWYDALDITASGGAVMLGSTPPAGDASANVPTTAWVAANAAPFDALAYNGMQVNGSMEVSQINGTNAVTGITNTGPYIVDGYVVGCSSAMTLSAQQVTDAPPGYNNSLKVSVTSAAASLGAGDHTIIYTRIEGYRLSRLAFGGSSAQPLARGFWVKANRTGTYCGFILNGTGARSYVFTFSITASGTWQFITQDASGNPLTIPGDTAGTWNSTTGLGAIVGITMACGTTFQGTARTWSGSEYFGVSGTTNGVAATTDYMAVTGDLTIPGIELPSSSRAPFIMRPYPVELPICQRYWEPISAAAGQIYTSTIAMLAFRFQQKRATPATTLIAAGSMFSSNSLFTITSLGSFNTPTLIDGEQDVNVSGGGMTAGAAIVLREALIGIDARL